MKVPYFEDDVMWQKCKEEAISWEGTPYRHLWMSKGRGADCTLFIAAIWKELGILSDVTYEYYPKDWHIHAPSNMVLDSLQRHIRDHATSGISIDDIDPKKEEEWMRGDMLAFALTETGVTNHAMIWFGDFEETRQRKQMYNSINDQGVCRLTYGSFWRKHLTNVFRVMKEI